jgi:hypothetical protein
MRTSLFFLSFFLSTALFGQKTPTMLLMDMNVQMECTEAVNDMYNFKFDKAEKQFQILKLKYPEHPLPYFLMGLSTWWQMMPNLNLKTHDDSFLAFMDSSITKAEKMYKNENNKIEAAFFLSAAHGFKAEFYGERESYARASFSGKHSLNYLLEYKENNDLSPEFLYGIALYNYYEVWIKEEYSLLKPILLFFPNGDKKLGLQQLEEVSKDAFYTRTEAQYQLVKIYSSTDENKDELALPIARYLFETYPDNAYFERLYARCAYYRSQNRELEILCLDILKKIEMKMPGYEEVSGRYAAYFLGKLYKSRNPPLSKEYFLKAVAFAEKINATDQGYYLYSLNNLAEFAEKEGNRQLAKEYYTKIKKYAPHGKDELGELKKEAKKNLKKKKY